MTWGHEWRDCMVVLERYGSQLAQAAVDEPGWEGPDY